MINHTVKTRLYFNHYQGLPPITLHGIERNIVLLVKGMFI